jgi:flagellar basal body-associated protein FliL
MKKSAGTSKYLFLAFAVIAAMAGYYFWTTKNKIEIPNILPTGKGLVTGIVSGDDKPSAVVNGVIVREGDVVNDIRVVRIYKDKVEFEKDGQRWRQRVKEKPPSIWNKAD